MRLATPPIVLLAALGAAPLLNGCVALGAVGAATVGVVAVQDRTMGEGLDDALASNSVKSRLLAMDRAGFSHVDVEVAGGRLLLSGSAPTQEHVDNAEFIARATRGVHEVYNEIQVGPNDRFLRSAADESITAQVRTRLIASPNVHGLNANIETHRGVVYLMGVARSDHELRRAAEIASTVPGVQRVVSLMTVRDARPDVAVAQTYQPGYGPRGTSDSGVQQAASTAY